MPYSYRAEIPHSPFKTRDKRCRYLRSVDPMLRGCRVRTFSANSKEKHGDGVDKSKTKQIHPVDDSDEPGLWDVC